MSEEDDRARLQGYLRQETAEGAATQRVYWRDLYEGMWDARLHWLSALLDAGQEDDPHRAIARLEAYERKTGLTQESSLTADGGVAIQPRWSRHQHPAGTELLPTGTPPVRKSSLHGQYLTVPAYTRDTFPDLLVDLIDEVGPVDAVIELGAGYGRNLFELWARGGPKVPYFAGELSPAARTLGERLAGLRPAPDVRFFAFDFVKPALPALPAFEHALVFTCHGIEQVHRIDVPLISTMASMAKRVTALHLEPFGFQAQKLGPVSQTQSDVAHRVGWNVNLFPTLRQAEAQGLIRLTYAAAELSLPGDPDNPTSIVTWVSPK